MLFGEENWNVLVVDNSDFVYGDGRILGFLLKGFGVGDGRYQWAKGVGEIFGGVFRV